MTLLDPEVEARPWHQQLALDDIAYRAQLAYLLRHSAFYREKLAAAGVTEAGQAGGLADISRLPLTEKQELRASVTATNPIGAHLCVDREQIVRIYSTSGTTGTPSYIPLTVSDLDNWVTGSARSYAASGIAAGQRIVSTYNAGPFVAGAALASFDRIGLSHIPVGTGNSERLMLAIQLLRAGGGSADAVLRRLPDRVGGRSRHRPGRPERAAGAGRGRARRRRAGLPRAAGAGLGSAGDRGDGHRRPGRVAVGRVRAPGRHAPGRTRFHPSGADRPGDGGDHCDGRRRTAASWC